MNDRSLVMIIDDDDSVRRAARRLIKSYGLAVDTFPSAEDFLASGRLKDTACLVLDVHMPGRCGSSAQRPCLSFPRRPDLAQFRKRVQKVEMPPTNRPYSSQGRDSLADVA
jgi:CheY-like chemotaxis protein